MNSLVENINRHRDQFFCEYPRRCKVMPSSSDSASLAHDGKQCRRRSRKHSRSKEKRHRKRRHYSDSDSDSTQTSDSSYDRKKKKKAKRRRKESKHKKKTRKKVSDKSNSETREDAIMSNEPPSRNVVLSKVMTEEASKKELVEALDKNTTAESTRRRAMAPMTQSEYQAQQSIVRQVYDPESGRTRLVRGTGEIIEQIVSRQQHEEINRTATRGDGASFAKSVMQRTNRN